MGCFGHGVGFEDGGLESFLEGVEGWSSECGGAGANEADFGQGRRGWVAEKDLVDRRNWILVIENRRGVNRARKRGCGDGGLRSSSWDRIEGGN